MTAYFDNCTLYGWPNGTFLNEKWENGTWISNHYYEYLVSTPIPTISTGECFKAWNTFAEVGHHICTRNDYDETCSVSCRCLRFQDFIEEIS